MRVKAVLSGAAADCPDAEVIFARGRFEPLGIGIDPGTLVGNWPSHLQHAYIGSGLVGIRPPNSRQTGSNRGNSSDTR